MWTDRVRAEVGTEWEWPKSREIACYISQRRKRLNDPYCYSSVYSRTRYNVLYKKRKQF